MKKFVTQQQDRDPHEILRDLKVEYARLFVGPGAVPAPPCESAYRNRSPSCGISAAQGLWAASVEADYRRRGLSLYPCHRDLPDHVSTELVFMYFLSRQEGEAWEECQIETAKELRRAQLGFLKEHLGGWLPEFCWRVQNATRSNLYWALAHILREFLVAETGRPTHSRPHGSFGGWLNAREHAKWLSHDGCFQVRWARTRLREGSVAFHIHGIERRFTHV